MQQQSHCGQREQQLESPRSDSIGIYGDAAEMTFLNKETYNSHSALPSDGHLNCHINFLEDENYLSAVRCFAVKLRTAHARCSHTHNMGDRTNARP